MAAPRPDTADRSDLDQAALHALAAEIRAYVDGPGERWSERIEREHSVPAELWTELSGRGYLRLAAPAQLGGRGLPLTRYLALLELFSRSHGSIRMIVHVCNGIWRPIAASASGEQIDRFLLPLVAGDLKVAFALTEPDAGSGADLRSSVTRDGDTYYLTGEKHLITFGTIADYLLVIARLDGTRGADGTLALMVPPRGEGVRARVMPESMGVRGTDHAHLIFDRAPVPVRNRLGAEGEGLTVALGGFLAPSRISLAMTCVGLAQRSVDLAVAYAQTRETFGRRLADRQAIAFKLAEMATDVQAARTLVMHAAARWEDEPEATEEPAMAKLFAGEMLQRVTDAALDVHGGIGYFSPTPIERVYRDARAQRFEEGTAEVQKMTIARGLLKRD
jgi:alkylation response protein AidB-like acyl-CoA dehydrogenase